MRLSLVTAIVFAEFCIKHNVNPDTLALVIEAQDLFYSAKTEKVRDSARERLEDRAASAGLSVRWTDGYGASFSFGSSGVNVRLPQT